jgi:hypothetical protein
VLPPLALADSIAAGLFVAVDRFARLLVDELLAQPVAGLAHLKAKQAGMPPQPKQSWAVPRRAINLMEALRRSIAEDKRKLPSPRTSFAGRL